MRSLERGRSRKCAGLWSECRTARGRPIHRGETFPSSRYRSIARARYAEHPQDHPDRCGAQDRSQDPDDEKPGHAEFRQRQRRRLPRRHERQERRRRKDDAHLTEWPRGRRKFPRCPLPGCRPDRRATARQCIGPFGGLRRRQRPGRRTVDGVQHHGTGARRGARQHRRTDRRACRGEHHRVGEQFIGAGQGRVGLHRPSPAAPSSDTSVAPDQLAAVNLGSCASMGRPPI